VRRARRGGRGASGAALLWLLLATCGGAEGAPAPVERLEPVARLAPGDSVAALVRPAAYAGPLPCSACARTATILILHPDGTFRLRERSTGAPRESEMQLDVGRWTLGADSTPVISLRRGDGAQHFALRSALRLRLLDRDGGPLESGRPVELLRVSAPPALLGRLRVRGEFRDAADAATLVTCDGGRQFPVAGDSAFVRLQRTHRDHPLGDGAATRVAIVGRFELRDGPEQGTVVETVVVDSFAPLGERERCDVVRVRATVTVGDWVLTALDGAALPELAPAVRPTMRLVPSEAHLFGNAGCNRFTARAVLRGLDLVGQPVALTKRSCADSTVMAREARYAEVLGAGGWFRLDGRDLVLSQGGAEVARFRRR
jgi:heat shock protein HslJ